jgi:hypothetical protein
VRDPRGASVTLSHYCPTARRMLDAAGTFAIVSDAAFPAGGDYVGLDVTQALPPALRPSLLMDWESWWAWEALAVEHLGRAEAPAALLHQLSAAVEHVRTWSPGEGALLSRVHEAFARPSAAPVASERDRRRDIHDVTAAVSPDLRTEPVTTHATPDDRVVRAFLAAHAFANWTAHLGEGLRTWLRSLDAAFSLLDGGFGVAQAELFLRHLADPAALAARWSDAERS